MFEAVIFDWDGTLADTRQMVVAAFQKVLRGMQCKVSDEFLERRIGVGAAETFREALRISDISFDEVLIKHLLGEKIQAEIDLGSTVTLFAGTIELFTSLQGKVKLALASMNNRDVIDHLLKTLDVRRFFDLVLTADEIQSSKPDPEIFLKTALKLGCRVERCLVVEDSIFGVEAAKAAKMGCIAVLTGVYRRKELEMANPDLIVASVKEQNAILKFIFQ